MSQKTNLITKAQELLNEYAATLPGKDAKRVSAIADSLESILIKRKGGSNLRSEFMGNCMRKKDNGGEGKDMSTCSVEWKKNKEVKK